MLNGGMMKNMMNTVILGEIATTKGQMPMGMLEGLLYLIPDNHI